MTIRLARYLVILSWIWGFLASFWYAHSLGLVQDRNNRVNCIPHSEITWLTNALLLLIPATQWLPGVVFMVAYIKIILQLRRNAVINPTDVSQSSQNRHRRNMRAVRILIIEVVIFLACLFPFYQHSFSITFSDARGLGPLSVEGTLVYCLMMTYSLINPFCHILLNSEFREEVVKMKHQLKVFFGLENNRVGECSRCHLPTQHLYREEMRNIQERTNWNSPRTVVGKTSFWIHVFRPNRAFSYASVANKASLVEPWFVFWQDVQSRQIPIARLHSGVYLGVTTCEFFFFVL